MSYLSRKYITMITALLYVSEKQTENTAKKLHLPVIKSPCPADGNTAREQAKLFAEDLDKTYGKVYEKVIGALERRHIDGWTDEDPSKLRQKSKPQN